MNFLAQPPSAATVLAASLGDTPESTTDYVIAVLISIVILLAAVAVIWLVWIQRKDLPAIRRRNRAAGRGNVTPPGWFTGPDRWWMFRHNNRRR